MKDEIYTAHDPASPDGDHGATVRFKKGDDGVIEVLDMLYGKPIPDWQKRTIELIHKYKGKRMVYMPPRRMGKSFFALMQKKMRDDTMALEQKLLDAVCEKLRSSWGRIVPGEEIFKQPYGHGGSYVIYSMPKQGEDHEGKNIAEIPDPVSDREAD